MAGRRVLIAVLLSILAASSGPAAEAPTYSEHVAPIVQQRCQTCHRPGEHAPFALLTYRDLYERRDDIRDAVRTRLMPPWKPVPGIGDFRHSRRLTTEEYDTILRWLDAGAPEGDRAKLPLPRAFPEGWALGSPDHVIEMDAPYTVKARAGDVYRCFVVPTRFADDRWVTMAEFAPGNRKIVHHVLTYLDTSGTAEMLDRAEPGPGYTCFGSPRFMPVGGLGGWAPGAAPHRMPEGAGMLLPAGARVVVQMHYNNPATEERTDRTRVALHFARGPIDKRVHSIPVLDQRFTIPAGARRHEVHAMRHISQDAQLVAISPHMHLLGREMKVTATLPDGTVTPLIHIEDWDFHWQGTYDYAQPVALPGGTRIDMTAVFDNSPQSPRQPSRPPRPVRWGEGTTDEMAIVFLRLTIDAERLGWTPEPR
jgi:hypothetical protein